MLPANPINPQRVFWELSPRLPDGAILTSDSGSCANWFARDLKLRAGMMASLSGSLATMGPGVPYAIAAKMAYPDRPVIAFAGDGAMQMNGNARASSRLPSTGASGRTHASSSWSCTTTISIR